MTTTCPYITDFLNSDKKCPFLCPHISKHLTEYNSKCPFLQKHCDENHKCDKNCCPYFDNIQENEMLKCPHMLEHFKDVKDSDNSSKCPFMSKSMKCPHFSSK